MSNQKEMEKMNLLQQKHLCWTEPSTIEKLKNSLKCDQISITSTDTILGFLANLSEKSFSALNNIKGERAQKPYLILISNKDKLKNFIAADYFDQNNILNKKIFNLIKNCWPGPLTIIFKAKKDLSSFAVSKENTIALRCPDHAPLQKLLESFDGLFSTSANKTGTPPPTFLEDIDLQTSQQISYVATDEKFEVDRQHTLKQTLPSTIIDISTGKEVKVVRSGAFSINELEKYYGSKIKNK